MNWTTKNAFLVLTLLLGACTVRAQDPGAQEPPTPQEPPKPAAHSIPPINGADDTDENSSNDWQPDSTPLTGLQTPSLGNPGFRHSYWVPGFQYAGNVQSNPLYLNNSPGWGVTNYIGATLSLLKAWSHSQLTLNYSGGATFTNQATASNDFYQQLTAAQRFQWRRLQLLLLDQLSYLPEAQFGFGGSTGLGLPGVGGSLGSFGPGLGGNVLPNQSSYSATGARVSNAAVVQATYALSPRQSITAAGSQGILHFSQAGNVDTADYIASIGYNYALTGRDTIGVVYRFTSYHYYGLPQALGDNTISLAYGRRITRRLAMQILAGPDYTSFRVPIGGSTRQLTGSGSFDLRYAFKNGGVDLNYFHGIGGGSGVLVGSNSDAATLGANHTLTRVWSVNGRFGFASNRALTGVASANSNTNYTSWFISAGVARPIGRNFDVSGSYTASVNQPSLAGCTGATCNVSYTQHTITIVVQGHTRPFVIE